VGAGRAQGTRLYRRKGRQGRRWGPTEFVLLSFWRSLPNSRTIFCKLRSLDCHPPPERGAVCAGVRRASAMQRAMLTALLVVCFIGPAHSQGVQTGANQGGSVKDRPRFNQARFDQAMGGIQGQKTMPGGPLDADPSAKKKAKQERCA
jgi:hypothetical protein